MKMQYIVDFGEIGECNTCSISFNSMEKAVELCEQLNKCFNGENNTNFKLKKNEPRKALTSSTHYIEIRKFNGIFPHN